MEGGCASKQSKQSYPPLEAQPRAVRYNWSERPVAPQSCEQVVGVRKEPRNAIPRCTYVRIQFVGSIRRKRRRTKHRPDAHAVNERRDADPGATVEGVDSGSVSGRATPPTWASV